MRQTRDNGLMLDAGNQKSMFSINLTRGLYCWVGIKSGLLWQFAMSWHVRLSGPSWQFTALLHKTHISPIKLSPARADPELWPDVWLLHCAVSVSAWLQFVTLDHTPIQDCLYQDQRRGAYSWCEYKHPDKQWDVLTRCHYYFSICNINIMGSTPLCWPYVHQGLLRKDRGRITTTWLVSPSSLNSSWCP